MKMVLKMESTYVVEHLEVETHAHEACHPGILGEDCLEENAQEKTGERYRHGLLECSVGKKQHTG